MRGRYATARLSGGRATTLDRDHHRRDCWLDCGGRAVYVLDADLYSNRAEFRSADVRDE